MKIPSIVLLEDDPTQAEWISKEIIHKIFRHAWIIVFESETALMNAIESDLSSPDLVILDLMVRFFTIDELEECETNNFDDMPSANMSGVRCRDALLEKFPDTNVVLTTITQTNSEQVPGLVHKNDLLNVVSDFSKTWSQS